MRRTSDNEKMSVEFKEHILRHLAMLACIVSTPIFAQTAPQPPAALKVDGGRYVFGQVGPARADQYLLDTQTGRLWQIVVDKEGRNKLQPVPFINIIFGDETYLPESEDEVDGHRQMTRQSTLDSLMNSATSSDDKE